METSSDISAEGMKRFVKHLCLISKKYEQREKARGNLDNQIKKIKNITLQTQQPKKWLIEREINELERKMNIALENERKLLVRGAEDSNLIRQLKDTIFSLEYQLKQSEIMRNNEAEKNRELITDLSNSVADLRKKINKLVDRGRRIKNLKKR